MRHVPLTFLAAVVLCGALAGCAGYYPTPPPPAPLGGVSLPRFAQVAEGVYRSAQPTAAQFREITQRYGIRTVIKLNQGSDEVPAGVRVIHRPLSALSEPSAAEVARILADIDAAPRPVLIHCTHGEDRTGVIVALYKMRHGASTEAAYTDMMRRGFHPYSGVWQAWLRGAGW